MTTTEPIGRYRLERELGRGGMASVFLGRDSELDRPVAVKVLSDALAGDDAFRNRFEREARLAAQLSHPNLGGV
jgi:serine/threonine-protein kinase